MLFYSLWVEYAQNDKLSEEMSRHFIFVVVSSQQGNSLHFSRSSQSGSRYSVIIFFNYWIIRIKCVCYYLRFYKSQQNYNMLHITSCLYGVFNRKQACSDITQCSGHVPTVKWVSYLVNREADECKLRIIKKKKTRMCACAVSYNLNLFINIVLV